MEKKTCKTLKYEIHEASSLAGEYSAQKILENHPSDPNSRWSSETNTYPQFITLKCEPAVVQTITFGKFEKTHVCNVKKFEIYGGLDSKSMVKLCEGNLRNDAIPETFQLRTSVGGRQFPISFLKIIPLQSWGSSFNYSIWHVELRGSDDDADVQPFLDSVQSYRQETALRMCLKLFREMDLEECYTTLQKGVNINLEHALISQLYDAVVTNGDFEKAEALVGQAVNEGFVDEFVASQQYLPSWEQLYPGSREAYPGMRGGHQMVLDPIAQVIYLFGGWDGTRDLSDFWMYDIAKRKWTMLSQNTEENGGPSARSCHKMAIDVDDQAIYVIGRYIDQSVRTNESLRNDFYRYNILGRIWTEISSDTYAEGGPRVISEHQIALDTEKKMMYVFGGKVIEKKGIDGGENGYLSGFYLFQIQTNTWKRLQADVKSSHIKSVALKPRTGHCIIFHPVNRILYIFGGHSNKEPIKDMVAYSVDHDEFKTIGNAESGDMLPVGHTQRATLDIERNEIYVYFGVAKDRERPDEGIENTLWIFNVATSKWSICYTNSNPSGSKGDPKGAEPSPRYAHQLVYDPVKKLHYLFGGNQAKSQNVSKLRLDDFWVLQLTKPKGSEVMRRTNYVIRKQKYRELCQSEPLKAIQYLQHGVAEVVDMANAKELAEFHQLPSYLFCDNLCDNLRTVAKSNTLRQNRIAVFSSLCAFFPEEMVPPRQDLADLIQP